MRKKKTSKKTLKLIMIKKIEYIVPIKQERYYVFRRNIQKT